jgi:hypothetical protein
VYQDEEMAKGIVNRLIDKNYQMDLISVLGRVRAMGDDTLGFYHLNVGERMKAWGKQGAFWGGFWGLLAAAAGFFSIPGVGVVAAVVNMAEAITGGALLGALVMAGAAAISQLGAGFHRAGIPSEKLHALHKAIEDGRYVLMLRGAESELARWREVIESGSPLDIQDLPYSRMIDRPVRQVSAT